MFANPLGLLALLALPAVVLLHLYRRRFRPKVVSALFLWDQASPSPLSGRTRTPLLRSPSFWCELLAALLLALLLAGPTGCGTARHRVVVLDGSASMAVIQEAARAEAKDFLGALWRWEKATIVVSGQQPHLLVGPAAAPPEAIAALQQWQPAEGHHDLQESIELAQSIAESSAILVISDSPVENAPAWVALGSPQANVGFVQASRQKDTAVVVIGNFGPPTSIRLQQNDLPPQNLDLAEGQLQTLSLKMAPEASLSLSIDHGGALDIDDHLDIPPLPERKIRITSSLTQETVALGLGRQPGSLERLAALHPDTVVGLPADLSVGIGAPWALIPHKGQGESHPVGPLMVEQSELNQGVLLEGAIWSAWTDLKLPGLPLIQAGNLTVLSEEQHQNTRSFHLNLDPQRSNLQRLPDWPIFLSNLLEARQQSLPGPQSTLLRVGAALLWKDAPAGTWTVEGQPIEHPGGDWTYPGFPRPGRYRVQGPTQESEIGVALLDSQESDLRSRSSGRQAPTEHLGQGPGEQMELLLLCGILGLVFLDLRVLGRQT